MDGFIDSKEEELDCTDGGMITKISCFNPEKLFEGRYKKYKPKIHTKLRQVNSDDSYKMRNFSPGKLIIINMKYFLPNTGLDEYPRHGTDIDAENLTILFLKLGYIVERYDNLSKGELLKVMKDASSDNYDKSDAFFCALLTHGKENILYAVDDFIETRHITRLFTGSNLAGKPKIFIIQACQGSKYMEGVDLDEVDGRFANLKETKKIDLTIPIESDFLFAYSTAAGFYSWRNRQTGSWFIQTLCDVFSANNGKMDLVRLLTRVNRVLAQIQSCTTDPEANHKRQIASIVSQLRKEFYFCTYTDVQPHLDPIS